LPGDGLQNADTEKQHEVNRAHDRELECVPAEENHEEVEPARLPPSMTCSWQAHTARPGALQGCTVSGRGRYRPR
jgi:hypothetical protein